MRLCELQALNAAREENRRLREENERLRRRWLVEKNMVRWLFVLLKEQR